ncbi:hypothetical Protein YC6258_03762 [Gynuella sunshinyii YC6258]|uniref:Uncharacterized protein n=1 Tax=Gynuella sunshinyii YC6258 TaxID=1445510 RepID=A0A0C5VQY2_9GAMM|nr:hypothetical Protein YC6258_03762 [Gynuella sunshinyii YC6258]
MCDFRILSNRAINAWENIEALDTIGYDRRSCYDAGHENNT